MNYKQMLDKFKELEQKIKVSENLIRALELRVIELEKPQFKDTYKMPAEPAWPREFWPTMWNVTCKENTK